MVNGGQGQEKANMEILPDQPAPALTQQQSWGHGDLADIVKKNWFPFQLLSLESNMSIKELVGRHDVSPWFLHLSAVAPRLEHRSPGRTAPAERRSLAVQAADG